MEYTYVDVKQEIIDYLKPLLSGQNLNNYRILRADPRDAKELPCIAINLVNSDEQNQGIGDSVQQIYDEEENEFRTFRGTFFNETLEIRVWHTNADERDRTRNVLQALLVGLRKKLTEKGIVNITIRAGRDEQENTLPPYPIYWSVMLLNYLNPLDVMSEIDEEDVTIIDEIRTVLEGDTING